jgi:maleylpyruvate isomerase
MIDQYEGGLAGREADIQAGSVRSARQLVEDVQSSAERLEQVWRGLPRSAWSARSRDANGQVRFLFELPSRRWQEVEVHLVDAGLGVSHLDWPEDFVLEWLPRTRERMWFGLPQPETPGFENPADELAWLYGRLSPPDTPSPPPWG